MKTYFAHISFGFPQMENYMLIEAPNQGEAEQAAYQETIDWADSFGFEQDEDNFSTRDEVGRHWDEDEEAYTEEGIIEPTVTLYIPAEHEDYL